MEDRGRDREARSEHAKRLLQELDAARDKGGTASLQDLIALYPGLERELRELHAERGKAQGAAVEPSTKPYSPRAAPRRLERIGRYHILDEIGQGGMGQVYLAEQREPIRRRVALKVIKTGKDTDLYLRRFKAERQALATMEHDAIAKVFDAGETNDGQPYFVMEHVPGPPITTYCDRHRLSTGARIDLMRRVCDGVQHAHEKGILHRDLKPSNILVAVRGNEVVPKIIDFGCARATDHRLHDGTFTADDVVLGTLNYMSPEQVDGLDVDARTDVFALGVLLYELAVGELPFQSKLGLPTGAHFAEVRKKICEEDPSPPSTALTRRLPADRATIAAQRSSALPELVRELRDGLDWIALRALEKDRTRRYATAAELADDLGRFLRHEPLIAAPPSLVYQLRKLVRRHRHQLVAGGAVLLAVALGVVGWHYHDSRETIKEYRKAVPELLEIVPQQNREEWLKAHPLLRSDGNEPGDYPSRHRGEESIAYLEPRAAVSDRRPVFRFEVAKSTESGTTFDVVIDGPVGKHPIRMRALHVTLAESSTINAELEVGDELEPGRYVWSVGDAEGVDFRVSAPQELAKTLAAAPRTGLADLDSWLRVIVLLENDFATEALAEMDREPELFACDPRRRNLYMAKAHDLLGHPQIVERLRREAFGQ